MKTAEILTHLKLWLGDNVASGSDICFDGAGEVKSANVLEALEDLMRRESALATKCLKRREGLRVAAKIERSLTSELAELARENDELREELQMLYDTGSTR